MSEVPAAQDQVLDLERLRTALTGVVDLAVARFGPHLDLDQVGEHQDYYWHLPVEVAYAVDDDPGLAISAGQSSDDLEELEGMVEHPEDQVLWHSATHLSELLRLVAFADLPRAGRRRPAGRTSPATPEDRSG